MASQDFARASQRALCSGACSPDGDRLPRWQAPPHTPEMAQQMGKRFSHRAHDLLFALRAPLPPTRPEILKHEMKVFFVKYNDPIYVKLEKLDIMIRLASQANIAQVSKGWGLGVGALMFDSNTTNELWSLDKLPGLTVNSSSAKSAWHRTWGSVSKHTPNIK